MKPRILSFRILGCLAMLAGLSNVAATPAGAATVVALGASNTYGKGVARSQAFPAQLETILRAKGLAVRVVNAGINGDATEGMLRRLDGAVPSGTSAVILQPNNVFRGLPHQPDGQHLTPEGYHMVAEHLAAQVAGAIGR